MLKVLIIDDEPNVRLGLKKIIPWEDNGFQVCGEGEDAEDGLGKIINLKPDIVLIDIKLPGKLGTEVIKEARKSGFLGKFIIVSGYSNFEYAKTGIKYGVKSYILKPIDEDELLECLLELKAEVESEKSWKKDEKLLKRAKLKKIILGENDKIDDNNILSEEYSKYKRFQIALISEIKENGDKLEGLIKSSLYNREDIDIIKFDQNMLLLFKDYNYNRTIRMLEEMKHKLDKIVNDSLFITLGCEVDGLNKLKYSYEDAKKLLFKKFHYLEKGVISTKSLIKTNKGNKLLEFDTIIEKLYCYVEISDIERIELELDKLEELVIQREYLELQIKILSIKAFLDLKQKLTNNYGADEVSTISNEEVIDNIYNKRSLKSTINYLLENFINISKQIGTTSSENIIKKIINFLNKNYYMDLKLETLAEIFSYNSSYLGKLFKNNVGENFNTYLDKIRIEKAKTFLVKDNLKVYQVCEKVGFKNIDYFHSKFKKYVGTSPLNYKKETEISR